MESRTPFGFGTPYRFISHIHTMETKYHITGMTCEACVQKVTQRLLAVDGVTTVSVSLAKSSATIVTSAEVSLDALAASLSDTRYILIPDSDAKLLTRKIALQLRRFAPLIAVFAMVLTLTSALILWQGASGHGAMSLFMGSFFAVFGALKLANLRGFAASYARYDWLAQMIPGWGYVYPFIEIVLAGLFISGTAPTVSLVVTTALMLQKSESVLRYVKKGSTLQCACLGGFFSIPITWVTFSEDFGMAVMAIFMLFLMYV